MKVEIFSATEENDYRDALIIQIDGKTEFSAFDGEPEDNSLCRNFGDCFGISDLIKKGYEAGLKGESFTLSVSTIDWAEIIELY